jgi:hypothetical protein
MAGASHNWAERDKRGRGTDAAQRANPMETPGARITLSGDFAASIVE